MIDVIGEILPQAFASAFSPLPILAVVLILATQKANTNGPVFLGGWFVGTLGLGIMVVLLGSGQDYSEDSGPKFFTSLLTLLLGLALLWFAYTQWRSRPKAGEETELPQWMESLDQFSVGKAFGLAFLLAILNTKNLPIAIGVGISIVQASLGVTPSIVVIVIYSVLVAIGVALPLIIYFTLGPRAEAMLDGMRTWLTTYNNVIMTVLFLILGANLFGMGLEGIF